MRNAWLILSVLIIVFDFISKHYAVAHISQDETFIITPFLNFVLVHNTGAAFGFLRSLEPTWERWLLSAVSVIATGIFYYWFRKSVHALQSAAIALIMGGAIGNFIDRAFVGHVIDFIQVHYGENYFPAFNIADSAITVGVVLLIFYWVKYERHH